MWHYTACITLACATFTETRGHRIIGISETHTREFNAICAPPPTAPRAPPPTARSRRGCTMSADNSMEDARAFFADSSKPQDLQVHKRNIVTCTRMGTSLHSSTRVAPRRIDAPADWHQYMYRRSRVTTLVLYYCDTSIPLAVVLRSDGTRKCWHVGPLHAISKQPCKTKLLLFSALVARRTLHAARPSSDVEPTATSQTSVHAADHLLTFCPRIQTEATTHKDADPKKHGGLSENSPGG